MAHGLINKGLCQFKTQLLLCLWSHAALALFSFRDAIKKYFLPSDFQEIAVTKPLEPEQKRSHSGFDVKVEFVDATTIDLLFSKNEVLTLIVLMRLKNMFVFFSQKVVHNSQFEEQFYLILLCGFCD